MGPIDGWYEAVDSNEVHVKPLGKLNGEQGCKESNFLTDRVRRIPIFETKALVRGSKEKGFFN